jgi:phasin family protein
VKLQLSSLAAAPAQRVRSMRSQAEEKRLSKRICGRKWSKSRSGGVRSKKFSSLPPFRPRYQGMMRPEPISEGFPAMAEQPSEQIAEASAASIAAVQELTKAYQELATKNVKNLTAAMQALAAVKSPTEFMELQQRLIKEGVEAAVSDSQHIAQLTTAVFTAAFEPVKKQIEALQKTSRA